MLGKFFHLSQNATREDCGVSEIMWAINLRQININWVCFHMEQIRKFIAPLLKAKSEQNIVLLAFKPENANKMSKSK